METNILTMNPSTVVTEFDTSSPHNWTRAEVEHLTIRRDQARVQARQMREVERKSRELAVNFELIAASYETAMTQLSTRTTK